MKKWFVPALALTAVAAASIGFGASFLRDRQVTEELRTERDRALDCRNSGATVAPCPVIYRNTRIEWHDRIKIVQTQDPKQTARIAALSTRLADAQRTVRNLERRRMWPRRTVAYGWQNGTMQRPYNTDDRCPAGSVVVYDAGLSAGGIPSRHSGDPNVCYVLTKLHRLALSSPRR